MNRSLFRYILQHTWRDQVLLLVLTVVSFPLVYVNLELPKRIVNNAIGGKNIPATFLGLDVDQVSYLMALSFLLLTLIAVNGVLKYCVNVYAGIVGERTMRRLRHDLYHQVLRFPLPQFKTMSAGEIIPMIVAETEPVGGFIGDSIVVPVFQGGLLLTYLAFIFMQDPWLGLAAVALYPPQIWLIPRLQRKINQLSKERVQTARQLSDRIGESVAGIAEIRANDTLHLERADISDRLGRIYAIRFDIYKRKFFVKFLNNFLAQITPFFFYSVGGYLVIKGSLSLGALVAVLAAYKDILSPWKELLNWYSTKEDVQIKYDQIMSQFEPQGMLDSRLLDDAPETVPPLVGEITANALVYSENGVSNRIDRLSLTVAPGERVALVGGSHCGKDDLTHLLARIKLPDGGRLSVAGVNFQDVQQAVPGRRVAFAAQNAHIFAGTLAHNLYYGLKHRPLVPAVYDEAEAKLEQRRVRDALAAGNSPYDIRADWIDYAAAGVKDADELTRAAIAVLRLVDMADEVRGYGLASTADREAQPALAAMALEARAAIRDRVRADNLAAYVELFDPDAYHSNLSVAENLLFGTARRPDFEPANLPRNPEFVALLREVGLLDDLYAVGARVAELMVELFAGVAPDSALFDEYSFIGADELPEFQALVAKAADRGLAAIGDDDQARLLALAFRLVTAQQRLGVIDERMQHRIVAARLEFSRRNAGRDDVVEFFRPDRFHSALSIQDNILFGRVNAEQASAPARISALVREAADAVGMSSELMQLGLEFQVGSGGSRLAYSERQRLAIARGLIKNPDVLVFNEPTSGLDPATEMRLLKAVLEWARGRTVIWALGRPELAREFDRVVALDGGRVVESGSYEELKSQGGVFSRLVA